MELLGDIREFRRHLGCEMINRRDKLLEEKQYFIQEIIDSAKQVRYMVYYLLLKVSFFLQGCFLFLVYFFLPFFLFEKKKGSIFGFSRLFNISCRFYNKF